MAYTKTTWVDGTTDITATRLNNIETGVDDAHAGNIDAGAIGTDELAAGAVTEGKIGSLAVTTFKIAVGAVTNTRLDDGAVTTAKLGDVTFGTSASQAITTTAWTVPAGRYWMVLTAISGAAAIEVDINGTWYEVQSAEDVATLVVSDGTNVRVRGLGASGAATLRYRVTTFS